MWRAAYRKTLYSVHSVLLETPKSENHPKFWQTRGTSFVIKGKPKPLLITNAHVVVDQEGKQIKDKHLAIAAHLPKLNSCVAGIGIRFLEKNLDIAIFEVSKNAYDIVPMIFAPHYILDNGTAVASVGFPIPPEPKINQKGGSLNIIKRLTTGFISSNNMTPDFNDETKKLSQYEINMLSYPGISGAPVFDINGLVVGINRGGLCFDEGHSYAYSYAIRSLEIVEYLEQNNINLR